MRLDASTGEMWCRLAVSWLVTALATHVSDADDLTSRMLPIGALVPAARQLSPAAAPIVSFDRPDIAATGPSKVVNPTSIDLRRRSFGNPYEHLPSDPPSDLPWPPEQPYQPCGWLRTNTLCVYYSHFTGSWCSGEVWGARDWKTFCRSHPDYQEEIDVRCPAGFKCDQYPKTTLAIGRWTPQCGLPKPQMRCVRDWLSGIRKYTDHRGERDEHRGYRAIMQQKGPPGGGIWCDAEGQLHMGRYAEQPEWFRFMSLSALVDFCFAATTATAAAGVARGIKAGTVPMPRSPSVSIP